MFWLWVGHMQKIPKWCTDGRDGCNRLVKSVNAQSVDTGRKWSTKTGKYPPLAIPRRCWPGEWFLLVFSTLECQSSLPPPSDTSFLQILHQFGQLVVRWCLVRSFLCMKKISLAVVYVFQQGLGNIHSQNFYLHDVHQSLWDFPQDIIYLLTVRTHSKHSCSTISNHNSWLI